MHATHSVSLGNLIDSNHGLAKLAFASRQNYGTTRFSVLGRQSGAAGLRSPPFAFRCF
jgi:hypothetical protein